MGVGDHFFVPLILYLAAAVLDTGIFETRWTPEVQLGKKFEKKDEITD